MVVVQKMGHYRHWTHHPAANCKIMELTAVFVSLWEIIILSMLTEKHPFEPFLPAKARILFLGSFPPQPHRWSMPFYYPNWINDFWRIMGLLFFEDMSFPDLG